MGQLMLKKKLKIAGVVRRNEGFSPEKIHETMLQGARMLSVNGDFTGRPETQIYASNHEVVKIRRDLRLTARQADPWLRKVLERECKLEIHHPKKTWFYIYSEQDGVKLQDEEVLIGNITPRLRPLHKFLELKPGTKQARADALQAFSEMFRMYLIKAQEFEVKLDEGLSNYALDADSGLFYVDDELYEWDKFISFSMMLGVLIRKLDWLDRDFARAMAKDLGKQLDQIFGDLNYRASIAYQLRSAFMPAGKKRDIANLICATLTDSPGGQKGDTSRISMGWSMPNAAELSVPDADSITGQNAQGQVLSGRSEKPLDSARPLALLADVHANMPALESVLDWLQQEGIEQGVVLGDLVGYGPDAIAVVERLQSSGFYIIKGNHDHSIALGAFDRGLSKNARYVAEWTREQLSDEQLKWLKRLPPVLDTEQWMALHGAPLDPEFFYGYVYEMTYRENLDKLGELQHRLCFHGHSHMPGLYGRDAEGQDRHRTDERLSLSDFQQALICPGSVGQPRNGYPSAQFAIYDPEQDEVVLKALTYDHAPVVERMRAAGFPAELYRRLDRGV